MHKIEFNMLHLKHTIESKTGKPYSLTKIADEAQIHRNTIQRMAKNKTARIDLEVMAKLMTLFASLGIAIEPNDFFTVTTGE